MFSFLVVARMLFLSLPAVLSLRYHHDHRSIPSILASSPARKLATALSSSSSSSTSTTSSYSSTEIAVIGSGISGLCCASLLATAGYEVTVFESHDAPGGCAHTWERLGYHFESGPSLYSGLSSSLSNNPLKNVFQMIGEEPEWITYDRWGTVLPEGKFAAKIGPEEFSQVLIDYGGEGALDDWKKLIAFMTAENGLSQAAQATPSVALREDVGVVLTLSRYLSRVVKTLKQGAALNAPFSTIRDELGTIYSIPYASRKASLCTSSNVIL